jgi:hypothetical protein
MNYLKVVLTDPKVLSLPDEKFEPGRGKNGGYERASCRVVKVRVQRGVSSEDTMSKVVHVYFTGEKKFNILNTLGSVREDYEDNVKWTLTEEGVLRENAIFKLTMSARSLERIQLVKTSQMIIRKKLSAFTPLVPYICKMIESEDNIIFSSACSIVKSFFGRTRFFYTKVPCSRRIRLVRMILSLICKTERVWINEVKNWNSGLLVIRTFMFVLDVELPIRRKKRKHNIVVDLPDELVNRSPLKDFVGRIDGKYCIVSGDHSNYYLLWQYFSFVEELEDMEMAYRYITGIFLESEHYVHIFEPPKEGGRKVTTFTRDRYQDVSEVCRNNEMPIIDKMYRSYVSQCSFEATATLTDDEIKERGIPLKLKFENLKKRKHWSALVNIISISLLHKHGTREHMNHKPSDKLDFTEAILDRGGDRTHLFTPLTAVKYDGDKDVEPLPYNESFPLIILERDYSDVFDCDKHSFRP